MKKLLLLAVLFATSCEKITDEVIEKSDNPPVFPEEKWVQVSDPSKFKWSATKLMEVEEFAKSIKTDALMIIEDGRLIEAYGNTDKKYYVASIRKSFLSVLYGYYVGEKINLNSTMKELGINDKNPTLNEDELKANIAQLLNSTSGIYHKSAANDNNDDLPKRNSKQPGEVFYYNNWDFNALGTIFTKQTGQKIHEDYSKRISKPIGMQDFNFETDGRLDFSDVSEHPAYHFDMTARDMARFGVLMQKKGNWNGQKLITESWISQSTSTKIPVGSDYGGGSYGYMWWLHDSGELASAGFAKSAFSAQGNWSQIIMVDPEKKLVIVHRAHKRKIDGAKIKSLFEKILEAKE